MDASTTKDKFPVAAFILFAFIILDALAKYIVKSLENLFLRNKLGFSTREVTSYAHAMGTTHTFFMPLCALMVSSFINRYVVIVTGSIFGLLSRIILSIGSLPSLRYRVFFYIFWFFEGVSSIILAGALNAFGGDQFTLPAQHDLMAKYYSCVFLMFNASLVIAFFIGPLIKTEIPCLGEQDCYVVGFALSSLLSVLGIVLLLLTTKYFIKKMPTERIIFRFIMCIGNALKQWVRERKTNPKPHWMDYAEPTYGAELVSDIKKYFDMLIIISTFPVFWSVSNQKNTKWLFQATRMDGRVGRYTVIPDHYQLLSPLLVLIIMPFMTKVFDPLTKSLGMDRVLRRLVVGGFIVSVSFVASGILESQIKLTCPEKLKEDECEIHIINNCNCSIYIESPEILKSIIEIYPYSISTIKQISTAKLKYIDLFGAGSCINLDNVNLGIEGGKAFSIFIQDVDGENTVDIYEEIIEKTESGFPMLSVIGVEEEDSVILRDSKYVNIYLKSKSPNVPKRGEAIPEVYDLFVGNKVALKNFAMHLGGVYLAVVSNNKARLYEVIEPNSVHIFWILPQTIILTIGQIYWVVASMNFIYTEAPTSLKQVVSATSVFADGLGDGIIAVTTALIKWKQDYEFYTWALIVALDMCLLLFLALRFKPTYSVTKLV